MAVEENPGTGPAAHWPEYRLGGELMASIQVAARPFSLRRIIEGPAIEAAHLRAAIGIHVRDHRVAYFGIERRVDEVRTEKQLQLAARRPQVRHAHVDSSERL